MESARKAAETSRGGRLNESQRSIATLPPSEVVNRGHVDHVSWLEAASFSFPGPTPQWISPNERSEIGLGPLTVAGPRRRLTGFRDGPRASNRIPRHSRISSFRQVWSWGNPEGQISSWMPLSGRTRRSSRCRRNHPLACRRKQPCGSLRFRLRSYHNFHASSRRGPTRSPRSWPHR